MAFSEDAKLIEKLIELKREADRFNAKARGITPKTREHDEERELIKEMLRGKKARIAPSSKIVEAAKKKVEEEALLSYRKGYNAGFKAGQVKLAEKIAEYMLKAEVKSVQDIVAVIGRLQAIAKKAETIEEPKI